MFLLQKWHKIWNGSNKNSYTIMDVEKTADPHIITSFHSELFLWKYGIIPDNVVSPGYSCCMGLIENIP